MAEAADSLRLTQLRASMGIAINVLARHRALNLTKAQLRSAGLKVSHFSRRDLVVRAEAYLAQHREELIAEAKVVVERWQAQGFFGRAGLSITVVIFCWHILLISESMDHHDLEIMDDRSID